MAQAVVASQSRTMLDRQVPLAENELRVPQYGEVWMKHVVVEGGAVRDGNILIVAPVRRKKGKR